VAAYQAAQRSDARGVADDRTIEQWRGVTLREGLPYERAAIEFWSWVATDTGSPDATDLGARKAATEGWQESGYQPPPS